uniref:Uncharacterized protein n=1 Tax=Solanum tuberosum TaxID=4113 RepID=M1DZM9_SOLTU
MEAVWHVRMPKSEFHALHGNICTLKDLPVGQHHSWMIAWSMGGLTKRRGASEECAPFGELEDTLATRQSPLARVLGSPTDPMSIKWVPRSPTSPRIYEREICSLGELKAIGASPSGLGDGPQTAHSSSSSPAKLRNRIPRQLHWVHRRAIRQAPLGSPISPFQCLCALIIEQRDECYYAEVFVCECFDAEVFADEFYYAEMPRTRASVFDDRGEVVPEAVVETPTTGIGRARFRGCAWVARERAFLQSMVTTANEVELMVLEEFREPKMACSSGQFSNASSGGPQHSYLATLARDSTSLARGRGRVQSGRGGITTGRGTPTPQV